MTMFLRPRERLFTAIAALSLLVCSSYLVLWKESNRNLWIAGGSLLLFLLGVLLSQHWKVSICAAFLFTGLRWIIGALFSFDTRAVIAAILFLGVGAILLLTTLGKQGSSA